MSQILENLRNVDPNNSDAVKETITAFFQNLLKHTEIGCNVWMRALENVITRFPRYCAQHRSTIENYISRFLDSQNYYNVIEAAKCAHGLQQIRPSQDKAATAKNCWREQMSLLCSTAHTLIDAVFSKNLDIYKGSKNAKKLNATLLSNTPLTSALSQILNMKKGQNASVSDKNLVLCNKLRNIFVFIQAMLVEVYPVAKPIQPQLILQVIVQALSVSSSVNTNVADSAAIKTQALRTLDAIISCMGAHLIPFSGLVFRCVMQTLRWSSDNPSEESRQVRCTAYKSLSGWLATLHVHRVGGDSKGRSWEDELTAHVISDVTPPKKLVQLTMSNQFTKNLSKKARRKLANTILQQSSIASHAPGEKNKATVSDVSEIDDSVANSALECAEAFLTACGIFLKPATHKIFQERLVRECYAVDSYAPERSLRLLQALDSCRKNTPASVPPPTQYLLQLYSTLCVTSRCEQIRKFCSQALLEIRLHLHCSPPSLNFALQALPDESKTEDKRKRLSEKNRTTLENLLGSERMPAPREEDVTITDEPSSKKPRLDPELIPENISVSSESVASIEISDDDDDDDVIIEEREEEKESHESQQSEEQDVEEIEVCVNEPDMQATAPPDIIEATKQIETDVVDANISQTSIDNESSQSENIPPANIHEAKTQVPVNLNYSTDTIDGDKSPVSMEIGYDSNAVNKLTPLDKIDGENLPSTNDTDDLITCGQTLQSSQEIDVEAIKTVEEKPKENGIDKTEITVEGDKDGVVENIEVKITTKEITVDDMLADFVDEVNGEAKAEA